MMRHSCTSLVRLLIAALAIGAAPPGGAGDAMVYDPFEHARASVGTIVNREAVIPAQCYTKTDGISNPCWTCHTQQQGYNQMDDWHLQREYAFSDVGRTNHWTNLFLPLEPSSPSADEVRAYIRTDNYTPLRRALAEYSGPAAWLPDLDIHAGFDDQGFAKDGSAWRALRYKPFPGTFWPTNGSTDDVMIRLPWPYRSDDGGNASVEIYKANLAIVEAALATPSLLALRTQGRRVEPVDEGLVRWDLDGDGRIGGRIERIRSLPRHYVGGARVAKVEWGNYPAGTEFLHTVRYLDPQVPNFMSVRMKEVRYAVKWRTNDQVLTNRAYREEKYHKESGVLPLFQGHPETGYINEFGWKLQGYIEDAQGRLRVQTQEEHYYCMGCHGTIGVTADQTFALPRKLPGAEGWRAQSLVGQKDVSQWSHAAPEVLTYMRRVRGADEFRSNDEMLRRFFRRGLPQERLVAQASITGPRDLAWLLYPSPQRALALNRAYMRLVRLQRFDFGRDPVLKPALNVHRTIVNGDTGFREDQIFRDGTLWLDWN